MLGQPDDDNEVSRSESDNEISRAGRGGEGGESGGGGGKTNPRKASAVGLKLDVPLHKKQRKFKSPPKKSPPKNFEKREASNACIESVSGK
jgi:hypothetical protein